MPPLQHLRNFDPELFDGKGNERELKPNIPPVFDSGPFHINQVNPKFAQQIRENEKLYACCRSATKMTVVFYQSPTANGNPDIMIATCGECNRKHRRIAVNPLGNGESRSLKGQYP